MSKTSERRRRQQERIEEERKSGRHFMVAALGLVAVAVLAIAVSTTKGEKPPTERPSEPAVERSGEAAVLGVEVDAQLVALGHVPLNTTVTPTWTLTNRSDQEVTFGKPHAEVVEGCCPGPLEYGTKTLAPGQSTDLTFPLQMHEGMDGPHEFAVHVPVMSGGDEALLTLATTGDFSG